MTKSKTTPSQSNEQTSSSRVCIKRKPWPVFFWLAIFSLCIGIFPSTDTQAATVTEPHASVSTLKRANTENDSQKTLESNLLGYFQIADNSNWTLDPTTDIEATLARLQTYSKSDAQLYKQVLTKWKWDETQMHLNIATAPDGLPTDNSHAFVVLGYALNPDGTMTDELIGRLQTALDAAKKYPNSYVLVTGGAEKNGWTEGIRMRDWLLAHGLQENRLIVEHNSKDTVQNAEFSFDLLYQHPEIKKITIISSEYHLRRAYILYYAESLLKAQEYGGTPIEIVNNVGWLRSDLRVESISQKVSSLAGILGISVPSDTMKLSQLDHITATNMTQAYSLGSQLKVQVTSYYKGIDFKRNISDQAVITGFDSNKVGKQNLTVSYTENGITRTVPLTVTVKGANKDALIAAIDHADTLQAKLYTPETFKTLVAALKNAKAVKNDPNTSQAQVDMAIAQLASAVKGLILVDNNDNGDNNNNNGNADDQGNNQRDHNADQNTNKSTDKLPQTGEADHGIGMTLIGTSLVFVGLFYLDRKKKIR